ncbi:MAG: helix-turn-helix domain-containing protein [Psychrobium sp.]
MNKLNEEQANILISNQLKKLRKSKGSSQDHFGAILGVSNQQYSKFESGKNRISAGQLLLIAQEYNIDINMLYKDCDFESR